MRLPHEQYIKFLITTGLDPAECNEHLEELGLPLIAKTETGRYGYFYEIRQELDDAKIPKTIKAFWKKTDKTLLPKDYMQYMNVVGLKEAWLYNMGRNVDFATAVDAVKDPDVSLCIRALLACKTPPAEVSAIISAKFVYPVSPDVINLFGRFFFNTSIMNRECWRNYMAILPKEEHSILYKAITGRQKELRAELEMPNKISVSEHYQQLHVFAMEKFNDNRRNNDPASSKSAMDWAKLAMAAGDKYEKLKMGDVTDFTKDVQMEFEVIDTSFPMIGQETVSEIKQQKDAAKRETLDKAQKDLDAKTAGRTTRESGASQQMTLDDA
jgi:hypothetical protein